MKNSDLNEFISKISKLNESVDILVKLTALNIGKDIYFKNKERKDEKIDALAVLELPDNVVALIVGSSPDSVRTLRSQMKNKNKGNDSRELAKKEKSLDER